MNVNATSDKGTNWLLASHTAVTISKSKVSRYYKFYTRWYALLVRQQKIYR